MIGPNDSEPVVAHAESARRRDGDRYRHEQRGGDGGDHELTIGMHTALLPHVMVRPIRVCSDCA